tara:strand:- start:49 stop:378 length:330 start_codon:yes stop_codon:yes gene_type:complete
MSMVIYVDIDETICYYNEISGVRDYSKALPIKKNIQKINQLYDQGNTIVYWTARGTTTGKDWSRVTNDQLEKWNVKFHECRLGKPAYDLFICDKAINSYEFFREQEISK